MSLRLTFAFAGLAASATVPTHAAPVDSVRQLITDPKGVTAPGCAVGAFRNGQMLFFQSSAAANIERQRPWSAQTQFYAASMSKQFTALAAAKLIEQGKLDLDDEVHRWLPELPQYDAPITVQMLIHHTSGIRNWMELASLSGVIDFRTVDRHTALQLLYLQNKTNFVPGTAYAYSNGGYLLLSEIVERAAGMPFHQYVKRTVLDPLGMHRSFILYGSLPRADDFAHGYGPVGNPFEVRDSYPLFGGSGGLISTIADFGKYIRDIQIAHRVWTPAVARIMLTPGQLSDGRPAIVDNGSNLYYAGGLQVGLRDGRYWIRHAGGVEGFSNMFALLPDRNLGIVLSCNRGDVDQFQKSDAIIEALEGHLIEPEPATTSAAKPDEQPTKPPQKTIVDPTTLLGDYRSEELPVIYRLSVSGEVLNATRIPQWPSITASPTPIAFTNRGDGSFTANRTRLIPDTDGQGFTLSTPFIPATHFTRVAPRP